MDHTTVWARVLRRCVRNPHTGCWVFQGASQSRGYGNIRIGRTTITTHRLSVLVRDGHIPLGMTVDHGCHESSTCKLATACPHRRCVNPAHLRVMTDAANNARKFERP